MIEEEAVVACIDAGQVWVEKERRSACNSCTQTCFTARVDDYLGKPSVRLAVTSLISVNVGDRVVVGVHEDAIIKGSFFAYLIPLLGLFGGAVVGKAVGSIVLAASSDPASIIGAVAGLIAAIIFLKYSHLLSRSDLQPVVLRKLT